MRHILSNESYVQYSQQKELISQKNDSTLAQRGKIEVTLIFIRAQA